jgi:hypothetical protein
LSLARPDGRKANEGCQQSKFLLIKGTLQNQENVISVKADVVDPLEVSEMDICSHDFH